jgi:prepilin-type N-terminal cleavage/methylation domain-containing protein
MMIGCQSIGRRHMRSRAASRPYLAFTLIEILVVCAIIGIVMTMAIPAIYRQLHPESMDKAVRDVKELCDTARGHAVLNRTTMKLRIRPYDKQLDVVQGGGGRMGGLHAYDPQPERLESKDLAGEEWRMPDRQAPARGGGGPGGEGKFSAKLSDQIHIEGIRVNLKDYTEDEVVEVNFYQNGTSDEFSLFLASNKSADRRQIWLEVATALAAVENDYRKFR